MLVTAFRKCSFCEYVFFPFFRKIYFSRLMRLNLNTVRSAEEVVDSCRLEGVGILSSLAPDVQSAIRCFYFCLFVFVCDFLLFILGILSRLLISFCRLLLSVIWFQIPLWVKLLRWVFLALLCF